jgi:hypothetical protein
MLRGMPKKSSFRHHVSPVPGQHNNTVDDIVRAISDLTRLSCPYASQKDQDYMVIQTIARVLVKGRLLRHTCLVQCCSCAEVQLHLWAPQVMLDEPGTCFCDVSDKSHQVWEQVLDMVVVGDKNWQNIDSQAVISG